MSSPVANHWKLGLFVVTGFALALAAFTWLGANLLERESLEAHYYFDEDVSGLEVGSPVQFRGVTIGEVADILAAPDRRHVHVISRVYLDSLRQLGIEESKVRGESGEFVGDELRVQLVSSPLTGSTFIQTDFFDPAQYPVAELPFPVEWNTVYSVPSTFKSLENRLMATLEGLPRLVEDASNLVVRLDGALESLDAQDLSVRIRKLLETAEERLAAFESAGLIAKGEAAFAEAELTLKSLREEIAPLSETLARFEGVAASLEGEIEALDAPATGAAFRQAADGVARLSDEARADLRVLRDSLDSLRALTRMLERDPGALIHGRAPTKSPTGSPRR